MVEGLNPALNPAFDPILLSRIEDAGLNASAPPQQRWMDGWLVRHSPGKARRARCINAVAAGRLPLDRHLAAVAALYREAGLQMVLRVTPFTQPATLDAELAARGWTSLDDTRVMVCADLAAVPAQPLPPGCRIDPLPADAYARLVGGWRGSSAEAIAAHAERMSLCPVPYRGFALRQHGRALACGQYVVEGDLVGLYDVYTAAPARGHGLARVLCAHLLAQAREAGAASGYLQVEADNAPARAAYRRLGFADGYSYRYRVAPHSAQARQAPDTAAAPAV